MESSDTLHELEQILLQRKNDNADTSYVASLYQAGIEKINAKVIEEANEVVEAASENETDHLIHEVADLWFHTMVLLANRERSYRDVLDELEKRFGTSGLVEKAQRSE